jgi:hypothetical protein
MSHELEWSFHVVEESMDICGKEANESGREKGSGRRNTGWEQHDGLPASIVR